MTTQDNDPTSPSSPSWSKGWESDDRRVPLELHQLQEKVHHLETTTRRLRMALTGIGLLLGFMLVYPIIPREQPVLDSIRTQRLEIISSLNQPIATLDSDKAGGRLTLRFNQKKQPADPAVFLYATPEGGTLQLYEPGHNFFAVSVNVGQGGNGKIELRGRDLQKGLELLAPQTLEEGGVLKVYNAKGTLEASLPGSP